ncbi:MAG TPA: ABC transporter ATP-binding protein [Anaerolineales bacterium]|nr:ABC transporter ATP-binding protein [Anaerolineales bacterium]
MVPKTSQRALDPQSEILMADNLQKSYGKRQALRGLSFSLRAGRVMGFLGPNGAGKTTAIRILTTILEADAGYFQVEGIGSEFAEKIRLRIGVLPESLGFPKQITAFDFLAYFGQLYGRSPQDAKRQAAALLEEVGLQQRAKSLVGTYSRGMRQRLGIARALIHDPAVVFLDEPTLGLDPRGQQELLALVRRIAKERNAGVILCSHLLTEIEGICDDVVILNAGHVVARGSVSDVIGRTERNIILRSILRLRVPPASLTKARQVLKGMPIIKKITQIGEMEGWLQIDLINLANDTSSSTSYDVNNQILGDLIRAKVPILSFEGAGGRLQDVFLHLTEETIE